MTADHNGEDARKSKAYAYMAATFFAMAIASALTLLAGGVVMVVAALSGVAMHVLSAFRFMRSVRRQVEHHGSNVQ